MANGEVQTVGGAVDKLKLLVAAVVLVAGLIMFYQLGNEAGPFGQRPMIVRVLAVLLGVGVAIAIALTSHSGRQFAAFFKDSVGEARRVVWPTRKETLQTTGIVFAFVVVMAIFLWLTDKTLEVILIDWILGWKK